MFGKSIPIFNTRGPSVRLGFSWFFLALFLIWSLAKGYFPSSYLGLDAPTYWWMGVVGAVGFFGSIVFHEQAHILAARRYGFSIKATTLFIFGGVSHTDDEPPSPKAECLMAMVGPLSSFALSTAWYLAFEVGYRANLPLPALGVFGWLAFANGLLAGFNLIPAFPLDGGRILRAGLWHWKKDFRHATRLACLAASLFGFALLIGGIVHAITGHLIVGIWWFFLGFFLREAAGVSYHEVVARMARAGATIRRIMTPSPMTVSSKASIEKLVEEHFCRSCHNLYPVMEDARLIGYVTSKQIAEIPRDQWAHITARDVAVPCSDENSIGIDSDTGAALSLMNRTGNSRLLVLDGDRLAGIVTLKDLSKFLTLKLNIEGVR